MNVQELDALSRGLIPLVMRAVNDAVSPLIARNTALELRILELETRPATVNNVVGERGEQGERGETGPAGKDAPPVDVQSLIASVIKALPESEKGDTGEAGPAGKDAPPVDVDALVTRVAALVPAGKDGAAGPQGRDGAPGRDGRDGQPGAAGMPGEKGLNGKDGRDGIDGKDGASGLNGKDGRDGMNGKDGLDGLGFDDYNLILDPMKGWILRLQQGDRIKDFDIPMPFFAGNWQAGSSYPKAAGVRWEGHYWWALKETTQQPGEGSSDWQLVVSRGKEGREGKRGKDGTPGRDLTQMGLDGKKW